MIGMVLFSLVVEIGIALWCLMQDAGGKENENWGLFLDKASLESARKSLWNNVSDILDYKR